MTEQQAMRMALAEITQLCKTGTITDTTVETIDALRQALEQQPADEPVALRETLNRFLADKGVYLSRESIDDFMQRLNTRPQPADELVDFEAIIEDIEAISCYYHGSPSYEHCPYKIRKEAADTVRRHAGYYTRTQPATWVGLTDEDREQIVNNSMTPACVAIATETKLKEKNT